jgi:putative ribosome biogenesis GTPase RsgA
MDPEWDRKWQRMGIKWTLAQEEKRHKCNEFGTVVVQITVNRMEMLLLLNTLKEQQIRILLGRTGIGDSQKVQMATRCRCS